MVSDHEYQQEKQEFTNQLDELVREQAHKLAAASGLEGDEGIKEVDRISALLYMQYQSQLRRGEKEQHWSEQLIQRGLEAGGLGVLELKDDVRDKVGSLLEVEHHKQRSLRDVFDVHDDSDLETLKQVEVNELDKLFDEPFTLSHNDIPTLHTIGVRDEEFKKYTSRQHLYQGKVFLAFVSHLLVANGFDESIRGNMRDVVHAYERHMMPAIEKTEEPNPMRDNVNISSAWKKLLDSVETEKRPLILHIMHAAEKFVMLLSFQEYGERIDEKDLEKKNVQYIGPHAKYTEEFGRKGEHSRDELAHMMTWLARDADTASSSST